MSQVSISPPSRQVQLTVLVGGKDRELREPGSDYDADPPTETRQESFAMIPASVLELHDGAVIAVYAVIRSHANQQGEAWPSMRRLEECLGWSDTRIRPALKKLIDGGLLEIEKRQLHGMDQANRYRLIQKPANVQVSHHETPVSHSESLGISPRDTGSLTMRDELDPVELETIELEKGDTPPNPQKSDEPETPVEIKKTTTKLAPEYPPEMLTFWNAYPQVGRDRSSKAQVKTKWKQLAPDADTVAAILDAVTVWSQRDDWRNRFAPGAHLFLERRKWEELPAAEPPPPPNLNGTNRHAQAKSSLDRVLQIAGGDA